MIVSIQKYFCAVLFFALLFTKTLQAQTATNISQLNITTEVLQNANCNQKAIIIVQAKDGLAPYEYQISKAIPSGSSPVPPPPSTPLGSWETSNSFSVDEGTYVIFAKDKLGLVVSTTETVTKDPDPKAQLTLSNRCVPDGNFEMKLEVTNPGIPPYLLSKNGGVFEVVSLPYTLSNQNSGNYNWIIKDSNGCESSQTLTILPSLALSVAYITAPSCTSNDGIVALTTKGGSTNFEYQINGKQPTTDSVFTNLPPGSYRCRVDDKTTGCFEEIEVNLEPANAIVGLKLASTDVSCNGGNDGAISVHIDTSSSSANNSSNYKYSIDQINFQKTPFFSSLHAGSYTVEVISERGCNATATISVLEPDPIRVNTPTVVDFSCFANNNLNQASISVGEIYGGSGNFTLYEFIRNNNPIQISSSSTYIESDLTGGEYSIRVYDSKGCSGSSSKVTITPFISLEKIKITVTEPINCISSESIQVSIEAKGSASINILYSLVDIQPETGVIGSVYPIQTNSTGFFTGLSPGKYYVTVLNEDTGCSYKELYNVTDPNTFLLTINSVNAVTCHAGIDGSIKFTITNKNSTTTHNSFSCIVKNKSDAIVYQNTHSGFEPVVISGLTAGEYRIQVTLTNDPFCSLSNNFTISEPELLVANLSLKSPLNCGVTPELELVVVGGTPSYTLSKDGILFATTIFSAPQKMEAGIGTYTFYIKDSKGCSSKSNDITIDSIPGLKVDVDQTLAIIKCNGETSATITAMASGGVGSYRYSLVDEKGAVIRPFQSSGVFSNLGIGIYITKAESNNCSPASSVRIIIEDITPLILNLKQGGLNEIIATPIGGAGNYKFTFNGEYYDDIPSYIYYKTQDFLVTVQDANGCTKSVSQKFDYIDICTPNYFTPNGDGINDTWAPGCSTNYTNLVFSIYDRYGQELGNYRYGQSWDGKYQGVALPSGDYWYILKLNNSKDNREFIGHFTLYR